MAGSRPVFFSFSFNTLTAIYSVLMELLKDDSLFNFQEVAIKKMRSNKSQDFFAELKVLCKIHNINVVSNYD